MTCLLCDGYGFAALAVTQATKCLNRLCQGSAHRRPQQTPPRKPRKLTFVSRLSFGPMRVGNLPALLRPGPSRRGICLMTESDARNAEYFFAARHEGWGSDLG